VTKTGYETSRVDGYKGERNIFTQKTKQADMHEWGMSEALMNIAKISYLIQL
jgi:hypothetical protein